MTESFKLIDCDSTVLTAYLTHTGKVPDSAEKALNHVNNCDWCKRYVTTTKEADAMWLNLQHSGRCGCGQTYDHCRRYKQ